MTSYVYLVQNTINGSVYVGKTDVPSKRWYGHRTNSCNEHLRRAVKKYGIQHFEFSVVEEHATSADAFAGEMSMIVYLRSLGATLYNQNDGGEGGVRPSEEVRNKIRAAYKRDEVTLQKRSESIRRVKSDPIRREQYRQEALRVNNTPEARKRHSDNARRLWADPEFREKQRLARERRKQNISNTAEYPESMKEWCSQ